MKIEINKGLFESSIEKFLVQRFGENENQQVAMLYGIYIYISSTLCFINIDWFEWWIASSSSRGRNKA